MRPLASLAVSLLLTTAAAAQTYTINGTLKGLGGEDYEITGTATLDSGVWTVKGDLESTTPPPPPQQCQSITAPDGSLTDGSGAVFTWGTRTGSGNNWHINRNGQPTVGHPSGNAIAAITMSTVNGVMYNRHHNGNWFEFRQNGWDQISRAPEGC